MKRMRNILSIFSLYIGRASSRLCLIISPYVKQMKGRFVSLFKRNERADVRGEAEKKMFCKEFRDTWGNGKIPEVIQKLRVVHELIDDLKTYGIIITFKEEIKMEEKVSPAFSGTPSF